MNRSWALAAVAAVGMTACARQPPQEPSPPDRGPAGEPVAVEPERPDTAVVDTAGERRRARRDSARRPPADSAVPARRPPTDREVRLGFPVLPGAVLPRERIVAFYGNPASTRMGILGELPPDEMLARLDREVAAWRLADPSTPVRPALHMIAVMAASDPGPDSLYRLRMPGWRIERVVEWADRRDALVFLDIQPGRSTVAAELPRLREWLIRPDVHLGLDPEWAMGPDAVPGTRIGSMSAAEINHAIAFLAELVEEHDLPPKVLVVHRFTENMVRDVADIRLDPRVQVVMNMDGWGPPSQKRYAYREIVAPEAHQFTGFKLFFKNDLRGGSRLMTPAEILELDPVPSYIQYQ